MKLKKITISLTVGLILSVFWTLASFASSVEEIEDNVLRLHIIANSDSKVDQALKIKVRDAVLDAGFADFEQSQNLDEAIARATELLPVFNEAAKNVISKEGFNYDVKVTIEDSYFNTRVYDDFSLPAGTYKALKIVIGKGKGKNWWCVMFPSVCISSCKDHDISDAVGDKSTKICKNSNEYEIRFKIFDWYESIKNKIFNNL